MMRRLLFATFLLVLPGAAAAQDPVLRPDTMAVADTIPQELPSPRGAFARAMLIPGWGHIYVREYRRAGIYFVLQGASWYMLGRTLYRLNDVKERDDRLTVLARDSLANVILTDPARAWALSDPAAYEAALLDYPGLRNARSLVRARTEQRQDWITYTLFFTFAAAVDAYVTAHLKDFPGEVQTLPAVDGGVTLQLRVPVGGRR